MLRITLLNPKGGCGKTTLATNLASYFSGLGCKTVLYDFDAQGSSTHWLEIRESHRAVIHGIPAYRDRPGSTRSWQLRVPAETERVIVDTPASVTGPQLEDLIKRSDRILIPVLASPIDYDAFMKFAVNLARNPRVRSGDIQVGVVANRVRTNTRYFKTLVGALTSLEDTLRIQYVTALRDTQHYVRAGERGLGLTELTSNRVEADIHQWQPLLDWLEQGPDRAAARPRPNRDSTRDDNGAPRQEPLNLDGQPHRAAAAASPSRG